MTGRDETRVTEIKFCGMTRPQDVVVAAELGARYVGCVFAGGPRARTPADATDLFSVLQGSRGPRRVGVFPAAEPRSGTNADPAIEDVMRAIPLHVAQVHGEMPVARLAALRARLRALQPAREVWAVVRCEGDQLPPGTAQLWAAADALLLDAHVPGMLGGTGRTLPWQAMADSVRRARREAGAGAILVLAGGLTADNVGHAIAALQPDIVDVSSGVERSPGVKDHGHMRAFADAVRAATSSAASAAALSPSSPLP
jgi:phosphoribosylanthranilate isomerase